MRNFLHDLRSLLNPSCSGRLRRPRDFRPRLEVLESRFALSTLSIQDTGVSENNSPLVSVNLSEASSQPVTVDFTTADGTAKAPGDYKATAGTLRFEPGETTKSLLVEFKIDN